MASLIGLSSDRATVSYSSADHNGTDGFGKGIFIGSNDAVVTYTMANHNEDEGLLVHAAAPRSIITFSSFNQNGLDGIRVDGDDARIPWSTANNNGDHGIFVSGFALGTDLIGNTANHNLVNGVRVDGPVAATNIAPRSDIADNVASHNGGGRYRR